VPRRQRAGYSQRSGIVRKNVLYAGSLFTLYYSEAIEYQLFVPPGKKCLGLFIVAQ